MNRVLRRLESPPQTASPTRRRRWAGNARHNRQQKSIRELSTTVLQVREQLHDLADHRCVLGQSAQATKVTDAKLLLAHSRQRAKVVLIASRVCTPSTQWPNHLGRPSTRAGLMGARRVIITGACPRSRTTLVDVGWILQDARVR